MSAVRSEADHNILTATICIFNNAFAIGKYHRYNINKLLKFAVQKHIQLSVIDDVADDLIFTGKVLSPEQLALLSENSRISGMISMEDVDKQIRNAYDAD